MVAERVHFEAGSTQVIENSMEGKDENASSLAHVTIYSL
jgi:hypothetical protein